MVPNTSIPLNDPNENVPGPIDDAESLISALIRDALAGTLSIPSEFSDYGADVGVAETLAFAYQQGNREAVIEALTAMSKNDPRLAAFLPSHPRASDEPASEAVSPHGYEPLADDFLPNIPLEGTGVWLDHYTDYAATKSPMTPRFFHTSAGLVLLSIAVARRLALPMGFSVIYPNLYVLWVAVSSLFRKTTALDIAYGLARRIFPHLLTPQEFTPEALLADMAGVKPTNLSAADADPALLTRWQEQRNFAAQRGGFHDEMSGMLARAGKDYNAGLLEFIMKAYDCADDYQKSTRSLGYVVVKSIYFTQIGAGTPAGLARHLRSDRLWENGWWARFAILSPNVPKPEYANPPRDIVEPTVLGEQLMRLYDRLPMPQWPDFPRPLILSLGSEVETLWQRYARLVGHELIGDGSDERLIAAYARFPVQALKIAMLLAAVDWPNDLDVPRIELPHLVRAIHIVEEWRSSLHRTLEIADRTDYDKVEMKIRGLLSGANGRHMSLRALKRAMPGRNPSDIEEVLQQMERLGEVESQLEQNPKGGRPTMRYHLISD